MEKRKMKTPILETERLLLRSFSMDDAQAVFHGWEMIRMLQNICFGQAIMKSKKR